MKFKIGKTYVGDNSPCFVVAELSGNHNGEFSRAKKMLIKAKQSGANAVKLQTYKPETITLNSNRKDFLIGKKSPWKIKKIFWSLYKNAFTPWEWHQKLFSLAKKYKKKYSSKIGVLTFEPMPKMFFNKELKNFILFKK